VPARSLTRQRTDIDGAERKTLPDRGVTPGREERTLSLPLWSLDPLVVVIEGAHARMSLTCIGPRECGLRGRDGLGHELRKLDASFPSRHSSIAALIRDGGRGFRAWDGSFRSWYGGPTSERCHVSEV
jgi:hypothetical protein